jgi:hypothetical protein
VGPDSETPLRAVTPRDSAPLGWTAGRRCGPSSPIPPDRLPPSLGRRRASGDYPSPFPGFPFGSFGRVRLRGSENNLVTEAPRRDAIDIHPGIRVEAGSRQAGTVSKTRFDSESGTNLDSDPAAAQHNEVYLGRGPRHAFPSRNTDPGGRRRTTRPPPHLGSGPGAGLGPSAPDPGPVALQTRRPARPPPPWAGRVGTVMGTPSTTGVEMEEITSFMAPGARWGGRHPEERQMGRPTP